MRGEMPVIVPIFVGVRSVRRGCLAKNTIELQNIIVRKTAKIEGRSGFARDHRHLLPKLAQLYKNAAEIGRSTALEKIGELCSPGLLLDTVSCCKVALKRCV